MDDYYVLFSSLCMYNSSDDDLEDSLSERSDSNIDLACYEDLLDEYKLNIKLLQEQNINTCIHGKNRCKIYCDICDETFNCTLCHNEQHDNHKIYINEKVKIKCINCDTLQKWNEKCKKCSVVFGDYFCKECNLIRVCGSDMFHDNMFHCKKCNLCYHGDRTDYKHCNKCDCCMIKDIYSTHVCIKDRKNDKCIICLDDLTNGSHIRALKCGHTLHHICCKVLLDNRKKCPLCKSVIK
jgi:RING finger and CHY zinc finger domain-containing protein 1